MSKPVISPLVRAVIFDCDGVLVDSWRSTKHFFNSILASVGLAPMNADQEEYCFMHTVPISLEYIIPGHLMDQAMDAFRNFPFEEELSPLLRLNPGVEELLASLADSGRKLAVNTNASGEQHIILRQMGIHHYFDEIITTEDVRHGKPSPEGAQLILSRFALDPDQSIFIGDSRLDCEAADAAGIPFWGYGPAAPKGQVNLTDFSLVRLVG